MYRAAGSGLSSRQGSNTEEWSVAECMRILRRRKTTLLWITCLGVLVAVFDHQRTTAHLPVAGVARNPGIQREFPQSPRHLSGGEPQCGYGPYIQTQAELLQQDSVDRTSRTKTPPRARPEFQPPSNFLSKLRQDIRIVPCGTAASSRSSAMRATLRSRPIWPTPWPRRSSNRASRPGSGPRDKRTNRSGCNSRNSGESFCGRRRAPAVGRRRTAGRLHGEVDANRRPLRGHAAKGQ